MVVGENLDDTALEASSLGFGGDEAVSLDSPFDFDLLPSVPRHLRTVNFMISRLPSFDPSASWTVYHHDNCDRVRRVVVGQTGSHISNVNSYGADAQIGDGVLFELLAELDEVPVPNPKRATEVGIDGMSCRFQSAASNRRDAVDVGWWGNPPEGFNQLTTWMEKAVILLETFLPASTLPLVSAHPLFHKGD